MLNLIAVNKFKISFILFSFLWKIGLAEHPPELSSKYGFTATHRRAVQIINSKEWTQCLSKSKIEIDTLIFKKLTNPKKNQPDSNMQNKEHPILKLLRLNQPANVPITPSFLYCSLDDEFSGENFRWQGVNVNSAPPLTINQATLKNEKLNQETFVLDLEDNITLLVANSYQIPELPLWLGDWSQLDLTMNQQNGIDFDFQFQRFLNGSILIGNNQNGADQKIYIFLTQTVDHQKSKQYVLNDTNLRNDSIYPFSLLQSAVKIRLRLTQPGPLCMKIFNIDQRLVRTIALPTTQSTGERMVEFWDGYDEQGQEIGNGIYLCKIFTGDTAISSPLKLVVLR